MKGDAVRLENTMTYNLGKFKMILDNKDKDISKQIKDFGWYIDEQLTTNVFKEYLKPGMVVLDLGANIGFYTMLARSLVGPRGKVFAFEPSPHNVGLIKASAKTNHFDNVTIIEAAVADKVGKATLYLAPDYITEHSLHDYYENPKPNAKQNQTIVRVTTVDSFLKKQVGNMKIDFIKMDIEGSETKALKGMKETLQKNDRLILITEFWINGFYLSNSTPEKYLKAIQKFGFKIYFIDDFKQSVYHVSIKQLLEIAKFRIKNQIERNKFAKYGDWYTNLLCIKQ